MSTARVTAPPKVGTRRAEIQDAAITLFAQQGYSGTSMEQIAAAVGLVPASLYNHWRSKQAILADTILTYTMEMLETYDGAVKGRSTASEALHDAAASRLGYLLRHARQAAVTERDKLFLDADSLARIEVLQNTHVARLRRLVEDGQQRGEFDADLNSLFATTALLEIGTRLSTSFLRQSGYPSWEEVPGSGMALRTPDGRVLASLDDACAQYGAMALRMVTRSP